MKSSVKQIRIRTFNLCLHIFNRIDHVSKYRELMLYYLSIENKLLFVFSIISIQIQNVFLKRFP